MFIKYICKIKKISVLLLAFIMVASLTPASLSYGAEEDQSSVAVKNTEELLNAIENANEISDETSTNIIITKDISLTELIEIPKDKKIVLQGKNGSEKLTISLPTEYKGTAVSRQTALRSQEYALVMVAGQLTVKNLTIDAASLMRGMSVIPSEGATLTLDEGALVKDGYLGNYTQNGGAGVRVQTSTKKENAGKLIMKSGSKVTGGRAHGTYTVSGIGVYVGKYGNFDMFGGEISDNKDADKPSLKSLGGGVFLDNYQGTFKMSGGQIKNNNVKSSGGGIYVEAGTFELDGGSINSNNSSLSGGGIYNKGVITIKNGYIENNNTISSESSNYSACGGGVYISPSGQGYFDGGYIKGNTAKHTGTVNKNNYSYGQGGGVCDLGEFTMTAGEISGNKATSEAKLPEPAGCGGGIFVTGGREPDKQNATASSIRASFYQKGGSIKDNTATNLGGGLYISYTVAADAVTSDGNQLLVMGLADYNISGDTTVKNNKAGSRNDNTWLAGDSIVYISDELGDKASIYIDGENLTEGSTLAEASNDYELNGNDAAVLTDNAGKRVYALSGEKIIKTKEKTGSAIEINDSNTVVSHIDNQIYKADKIVPDPSVTMSGKLLEKGKDYTLTCKNNIDVGLASVKIVGKGEYEGSVSKTFNILARPIEDTEVIVNPVRDKVYTGSPLTPSLAIEHNGNQLIKGRDYDLTYSDNTEVGVASISIKGKGNYTGSKTITFKILSQKDRVIVNSRPELLVAIANISDDSNNPTEIYVNGNINMTTTISIGKNKYVKLIGNTDDAKLIAAESDMGKLLSVEGNLIVEDLVLDGNSKLTVVENSSSGKVSLLSGSQITGGNGLKGSGVYNAGNLLIDGGKISDNKKPESTILSQGGGVHNASSGSIEFVSGKIDDNLSNHGFTLGANAPSSLFSREVSIFNGSGDFSKSEKLCM